MEGNGTSTMDLVNAGLNVSVCHETMATTIRSEEENRILLQVIHEAKGRISFPCLLITIMNSDITISRKNTQKGHFI